MNRIVSNNHSVESGSFAWYLANWSRDNPKEVAIHEKTADMILRHPWTSQAFHEVATLQHEAMRQVMGSLHDGTNLRDLSQSTFHRVSALWKTHLADEDSERLLGDIPDHGPIMVTTNHLGQYHFCGIPTRDLGVELEQYPYMFPFWGYVAGLHPVAELTNRDLSYVCAQFPEPFNTAHQALGFMHIPTDKNGSSVEYVENQVQNRDTSVRDMAIVYFPEGVTSGKPNESDPYHLAPFRKGAYAVAHNTGMPRVLVAQFFHPEDGLKIKVLDVSVIPKSEDSRGVCAEFSESDRCIMQAWLDEQVGEMYPEVLEKRKT